MRKFVGSTVVAVALLHGAAGFHALTLDFSTITTNSDVDVADQLSVEVATAFMVGAAGASLRGTWLSASAEREVWGNNHQ